jgi:hypothetical protein
MSNAGKRALNVDPVREIQTLGKENQLQLSDEWRESNRLRSLLFLSFQTVS